MKYLISINKNTLELINQRINDKMFEDIPNYEAIQWGKIRKHPELNKYVLSIGNDDRNPLDSLTNEEKESLIDELSSDWFKDD
tara:strand:+ start:306 stop:554 length:249 start_codon:yes stop_codon:yes gene_type:complete